MRVWRSIGVDGDLVDVGDDLTSQPQAGGIRAADRVVILLAGHRAVGGQEMDKDSVVLFNLGQCPPVQGEGERIPRRDGLGREVVAQKLDLVAQGGGERVRDGRDAEGALYGLHGDSPQVERQASP